MAEPKSIADLEKNADDGSIGYDVHGSFSYVGHNQQRNPGSDQINMVAQDDEARDGVEEEDHAGVPTQEEKDCEVDQEDLERAVTTSSASPPVHSVFSHRYKIFIVTIGTTGLLFSGSQPVLTRMILSWYRLLLQSADSQHLLPSIRRPIEGFTCIQRLDQLVVDDVHDLPRAGTDICVSQILPISHGCRVYHTDIHQRRSG